MRSRILIFLFIIFLNLTVDAQVDKVFFIEIDKTEACQTLSTTFKTGFLVLAPAVGLDTLIVDFGDGNADTLPDPIYGQIHTHTYNAVGDYTIKLTGIKGNSSKSASQPVNVYALPNSNFTYADYGYPGILDTFYFSNRRYIFTAENPANVSHTWVINSDTIPSVNDTLVHHFGQIGQYRIGHSLVLNGCESSSSQIINIKAQDVIIPNVFSPNNDGKNDLFYIQTDGVMEYKFTVHNRHGSRVYLYEGKLISWDGRSYWGEELSPGNYYYSLIPKTGETRTGVIYLAR